MPKNSSKWVQIGPEPLQKKIKKNEGIFRVKSRMAYRQTLKLGMDKSWKNEDPLVFVRVSPGHFALSQGQFMSIFGMILYYHYLIFSRIAWFFLGPKNLQSLQLELKRKLSKYFLNTVCAYLKTTSGKIFSKIKPYLWD